MSSYFSTQLSNEAGIISVTFVLKCPYFQDRKKMLIISLTLKYVKIQDTIQFWKKILSNIVSYSIKQKKSIVSLEDIKTPLARYIELEQY